MIDLNKTPEAVFELKQGDVCVVDGREFNVCVWSVDDKVYLTTTNSRADEYNRLCERAKLSSDDWPEYHLYIRHVRHPDEARAVMTREELRDILIANTYTIG